VLVRMTDRDGNLVPATGFMPAAERYNLLTSIERWVVSSLVDYLHRQWTSGRSRAISTRAARRIPFGQHLRREHQRRELPGFHAQPPHALLAARGLLCFEITETTAIANLAKAAELMRELKGMGCRFALDDFGTGMSSFAYLKHLPVDHLKIAGVFVKEMTTDPMDNAIVEAVNRVGHILGMQTVAESVEDAATLAKITALGIDYAQGYYIAQPEPFPVEIAPQPAVAVVRG
jgi:EAL domain-containing protein (putative c-di-GMP-specific phosphodiesterase class I)